MIVALSNDLSVEGIMMGYVDSSTVMEDPLIKGNPSLMFKGASNALIPEFSLSGCVFDLSMDFSSGGHDESLEVFGLQDDYIVAVILALVMVISLTEEISLLVGCSGLVP
ncbi:uncharacterized protein ARMOST_03201 [Armillaria ostoyae]|uniref:Uncharacterized protein n=1 Tax=Armillaria ostoyae TaxID=47428 RepID=A0A284QTT8_ARMOS|nr:uncharacterized protein ARMOST_03201 [Armillaria ostoyae]